MKASYLLCLLIAAAFVCSGCGKRADKETLRIHFQEYTKTLLQECILVKEPKDFEIHEEKVSELFEDLAEVLVAGEMFSFDDQDVAETEKEKELLLELHTEVQRILRIPGGEEWLLRCQTRAVRFLDKNSQKKQLFP